MKSKSFLTGLLIAGFSAFLVFSVFNFAFADWTEPGPCANGDGTPPSCNVPVPLNINAEYYSGNIDINGSYTGTIDGRQQIRMDLDASNCASSSILAWDGDNWHCTSTFSGIGLWSTSATNPNSIFNTNLSGRVGIGTDSPNNPLEVRGLYDSDNPKAQFSISNPTSTANLYLVNGVAAGGMSYNYGYNNLLDDTSRYGVDFLLDNNGFNLYSIAPVSLAKSNLMVVRADTGYVGIGTTTPNRHLHVYDTSINPEIDLQGVSGNNNHWAVYNNIGNGVSADSNSFNVWGGSTWLSILRNGNVGIGTSTPTRTLSIANNGGMSQIYMRTNNSTYGTYLVSGNSGSYWGANGDPTIGGGARDSSTLPIWYMGFSLYGLGSPSNPMGDFYRVARVNPGSSTSDTLFLVSGSGNVGIGTTTPKSNMELVGHMGSGGSRNLRVTFSTPSYPDGGQLKGTEFSALTNLRSDLNSDDPLNMGSNWTAMYAKAGSVAGNYAGMFNGDVSIFNDAGSAKLCLNGDCRTAWPASSTGSGSGSGVSFWSSSTVNTNDIYNNNSGNVGIGTNAPTSPLTVSSSSPQIALINPGSTMKMHLIGGVGAGGVGYNYTYNAANKLDDQGYYGLDLLLDATGKEFDFMGFSPGASPVKSNLMTIEADTGNIGIGTTSPNSSLHVYKDSGNSAEIDLQSVAGANNQWAIYNGRSDNSLRFWQGGDRLAILPGGNVGVGTTTPAAALEVVGTSKFSRGGHYLIVNPNYAVSNSYSQIQTDLPLIFATGGDYNRMYISSSTGNVGIGSMTPGAKLEVKSDLLTTTSGINKGSVHINPKFGSVGNVGSLTFGSYGNDSAEAGIYVPSDVSGTDMFFDTTNDYSSGAQSRMVLNHTGNLGLGVTSVDPSIKFNIYDATYGPMISLQGIDGNWKGLRFGDLANNEQWFAGVDGSSNYRLRRSSTVDYLNIDPIGHVGINTTAGLADKTLTVNGDIRVTSRFYDSSNNEGTAGYVLKSTATGTAWVATSTLGFGIGPSLPSGTTGQTLVNSTGTTWTATSAIFVSSTGNVGIGTLTPDNLLQVKDLVDFDSLGNTKLGYQAGKNVVGGTQYGTYIGYQAGFKVGSYINPGNYNSALGYQSLYSNSSGSRNVSLGYQALFNNQDGYDNIALGYQALFGGGTSPHTSGMYNIAIGSSALYAGDSNNSRNIAIGYNALNTIVSGQDNVGIGFNAQALSTSDSNSIVIGSGAIGAGSNSIVLGNDNIIKTILKGNVYVSSTGSIRNAGAYYDSAGSTGTSGQLLSSMGTSTKWISNSSSATSFVNVTPTSYNGSVGGYKGANSLCNAAFSGSHICSGNEILSYVTAGGDTSSWGTSITYGWYANGLANDCKGYSSAAGTDSGSYYTFNVNGGYGATTACSNSRQIVCCK